MPKRLVTMGQRWPWHSHRGGVLVCMGAFMVLYGYSLHRATSPTTIKNISYAFHLMTLHQWGTAWMVAGAVVAAGGLFVFDLWFFALGSSMFGMWTGFFVVAWVTGHSMGTPWLNAAFFAAFTGLLIVCAGWPDARPNLPIRGRGHVRPPG